MDTSDAALTKAIDDAADRLEEMIRTTPVMRLERGAFNSDARCTLKLEHLQHSGSFKARGAINSLLTSAVPRAGVVAASGGNHGAAVAYAAMTLGIPAEIFVPTIASAIKVERLRSYGAVVHQTGSEFQESLDACSQRASETGAISIHAYDQPSTVIGQGTVGREFESQVPELETLLVAVGGGGLIGGIAGWYQGRVKIVAVETEGTSTLNSAIKAGEPVDIPVSGIAADALGARRIGNLGFELSERYVGESVLVTDDAVREARDCLWSDLRLITEPAAASVVAALISGAYVPAPNEHVGLLICGGNANIQDLVR